MKWEGSVEDIVDVAEVVDHALVVGVEEEDFLGVGPDDEPGGRSMVEPDNVEAREVGDVPGRADVEDVDASTILRRTLARRASYSSLGNTAPKVLSLGKSVIVVSLLTHFDGTGLFEEFDREFSRPNKAKPQAKESKESWNLQYRQPTAGARGKGLKRLPPVRRSPSWKRETMVLNKQRFELRYRMHVYSIVVASLMAKD